MKTRIKAFSDQNITLSLFTFGETKVKSEQQNKISENITGIIYKKCKPKQKNSILFIYTFFKYFHTLY